MSDNEKVKVLVVEKNLEPYVKEVAGTLEAYQDIVNGYLEEHYPFKDKVVLICDEEAKLKDALPNRYINNFGATTFNDIIYGTFFIAGIEDSDFVSLTDEQIEKYKKMFTGKFAVKVKEDESSEKVEWKNE